ncbi:hypothetical protein FVE85_8096 [Porphyridium purpureum]|uniref:Uncharacterized protein n=1 Tax=Porphyridium purpureum TaxID=35688 RepID=A0A5J4YMD5_PORPP|nr:hypothetical protein FVE85_8096 [Porphyridium purpureum]|eukprot:POR0442..scf295_9
MALQMRDVVIEPPELRGVDEPVVISFTILAHATARQAHVRVEFCFVRDIAWENKSWSLGSQYHTISACPQDSTPTAPVAIRVQQRIRFGAQDDLAERVDEENVSMLVIVVEVAEDRDDSAARAQAKATLHKLTYKWISQVVAEKDEDSGATLWKRLILPTTEPAA